MAREHVCLIVTLGEDHKPKEKVVDCYDTHHGVDALKVMVDEMVVVLRDKAKTETDDGSFGCLLDLQSRIREWDYEVHPNE